jgi:predicted nucleic acid-binding protein
MILADTSVLLDIVTGDPAWSAKSLAAFAIAQASDQVAINDVIFAELSVGYDKIEDLELMLAGSNISLATVPRPALFLAGKAYLRYRRSAGTKTGVLPDFFIGAHAAVVGAPLLTRDAGRVRTHFPGVTLIEPR